MDKNLAKLQRLLSLMDEDTLTKEDFAKAFKSVVDFVKKIETNTIADIRLLKSTLDELKNKLEQDNSSQLSGINNKLQASFDGLMKEHANTLNFLRDKMRDFESSRAKKDSELVEDAIERALELVPDVEFPESEKDQELYDSVEVLQAEIKRLENELKELRESRKLGGGGGTSAAGVKFALGKGLVKETPTGAINGSNKAYTLARQPNAILSLAINGQVINDDEYTLAGNTITMTSAIPADLSGTSFRVTYI